VYVVFTVMSRVDVILRSVCFPCGQCARSTNILCPKSESAEFLYCIPLSDFLISKKKTQVKKKGVNT
jgi:hypothetical protein